MAMSLPQAMVLSHPTEKPKVLTTMAKSGWIGLYADDRLRVL